MKESEGLYRSFRFLKKALIGLAIVVVALLLFGYFFFMRHVDAPRAWAAADRELQGDMLHFGEKVQRKAKVFMRRPSDYYRGANGMLYATNERLKRFESIADKTRQTYAAMTVAMDEAVGRVLDKLRSEKLDDNTPSAKTQLPSAGCSRRWMR